MDFLPVPFNANLARLAWRVVGVGDRKRLTSQGETHFLGALGEVSAAAPTIERYCSGHLGNLRSLTRCGIQTAA
jgi:hypothetical protein